MMSDSKTSYTVEWYVPKRVILIQYNEMDITADVLQKLSADLEKCYQEGETPIHIISDNTHQGATKVGLQELKQGLAVMKQANWGWTIFLGANSLVNFFATVISNIFSMKIRKAQSLEEALGTLERLDFSLSEIIANE
jgi:hypothetical protein